MSEYGKLLLTMCDNDCMVDLDWIMRECPWLSRVKLRITACFIGLRIKGGS